MLNKSKKKRKIWKNPRIFLRISNLYTLFWSGQLLGFCPQNQIWFICIDFSEQVDREDWAAEQKICFQFNGMSLMSVMLEDIFILLSLLAVVACFCWATLVPLVLFYLFTLFIYSSGGSEMSASLTSGATCPSAPLIDDYSKSPIYTSVHGHFSRLFIWSLDILFVILLEQDAEDSWPPQLSGPVTGACRALCAVKGNESDRLP